MRTDIEGVIPPATTAATDARSSAFEHLAAVAAGIDSSGMIQRGVETLVRTIVTLADALDLDIVAEGVENEFQARFLRELGCRHDQGFLWSASLPPDEAQAWIRQPPIKRPSP